MRRFAARLLVAGAVVTLAHSVAFMQDMPDVVTLDGLAVLPADTFAEGPGVGGAINPSDNLNGRTLPFEGQPVQGFSAAIPAMTENHYYVLSDNGYGARENSTDYNLRFYEVMVDFLEGTVEVVGFTELSDPNGLIPFALTNDDDTRVLTGADFDVESFRMAPDGTFWFGEEFGPYLLHTDADGVLLEAPIPTPYPEVLGEFARELEFVQSPQNPAFVDLADNDARLAAANLRGSRGFEGMAISPDGTTLYPMLEGALIDDTTNTRLLIQAFDIESQSYTGDYYFYPLSNAAHAIGELTAINETEFLVIERDNLQGEAAAFKRVYRVDFNDVGEDGVTLNKTLVADLLAIYDVGGLTSAEEGAVGLGPVFKFPFQTIESVYPIDANTLLLVDDNNYPFSNGRRPGTPDDNEFILISLPEALNLAE